MTTDTPPSPTPTKDAGHTPGEWKACHIHRVEKRGTTHFQTDEKFWSIHANYTKDGLRHTQVLAEVYEQAGKPGEAEANAKAMAQSKSLLAECEALRKEVATVNQKLETVRSDNALLHEQAKAYMQQRDEMKDVMKAIAWSNSSEWQASAAKTILQKYGVTP